MSNDLARLFSSHEQVARWRAESENASARLDLALTREASAFLLSQYEPVNKLGVNREPLRVLLAYLAHHDKKRLEREVAAYLELNP